MQRYLVALSLACLAAGGAAWAADGPDPEGGAYLGVLFAPIPDILYDQLPDLTRGSGVLVTQVLADSPAEKAGLRRNDVLLQYDEKKVRDCDDLVRLLQNDAPGRTVKLTLLRGGKPKTVDAALTLGPAIRTAQEAKTGPSADGVAPGVAKPNGPAAVSVAATPLERGRMKVTVEFYPQGASRLRRVTCEGDAHEIDSAIAQAVPERERGMVQVALKRIWKLNAPKDGDPASP